MKKTVSLKDFLQALWFNLTFYGINLVMSLGLLWSLALPRKYLIKMVWIWLATVAWVEAHISGIRYKVVGRENLPPEGSFILASKHQSEWETFKMHVLVKDPAIVMKKELQKIPVVGWYMERSGAIPIDRKAGARALITMVERAKKAAAEGRPIVIFPEGTRVGIHETRPYKSGIAALYQELNLPIVPLALNSGMLWPKNTFFKKWGTITVEFLPPILPGLPKDEMMKRLHNTLEDATRRLVEKA